MIEYIKASKNDKAEIIDFINYVFSHDYRPHDFKTLLPKAYSDGIDGMGAEHYVVKEDGKIRAVVANRTVDAYYFGNTLKIGLIGSVTVHPYSRGKGYMKKLMGMAIADAEETGVQLLMLSGKRRRYEYFGFENAGIIYNFVISSASIRRALADVDASSISYREMTEECTDEIRKAFKISNDRPCRIIRKEEEFFRVLNSWSQKCYAIYKNGIMIGYSVGMSRELVLDNDADYPAVIKALFGGMDSVNIPIASYERNKIEFLSSICENYSIGHVEKACVLDWKSVISILLELKSKTTVLDDGEHVFCIDGECMLISVNDNKINVSDAIPDEKTKMLEHNQAERVFFELDGLLNNVYGNWFPLPLYIDSADAF